LKDYKTKIGFNSKREEEEGYRDQLLSSLQSRGVYPKTAKERWGREIEQQH